MKRIFILLAILISLTSFNCDIVNFPYDFYNFQIINEEFKTIKDVEYFINDNIKYTRDISSLTNQPVDQWKTPQETWDSKKGDCEDKAILALAIIEQKFGIEGYLVSGKYTYDECAGGHAWYEVNGISYMKQTQKEYNLNIKYKYYRIEKNKYRDIAEYILTHFKRVEY